MPSDSTSRRNLLRATAGISIAALAGCSGGGGGSDSTITMGGSSEGSNSYQTTQSIQRVLSNEAEDARWDTQTTGGDPGSIRTYNEGDVEGYPSSVYIVKEAMNGAGAFEGEDIDIPLQGFHWFNMQHHFISVDGSGIQTTDDIINNNASFWPLPPGWGTRALFEQITPSEVWDQLNVVNAAAEDVPGAVEEGRVDAFLAYGVNGINIPPWLQEVDARAEISAVEVNGQFQQMIEDAGQVNPWSSEVFAYEQDLGSDTISGYGLPFQYFFSPDIPDDIMYEVMEVCHNNVESIREGQPAFMDYQENPELFVDAYDEDLPGVHPGVADYYEEIGVWDDSMQRGGE